MPRAPRLSSPQNPSSRASTWYFPSRRARATAAAKSGWSSRKRKTGSRLRPRSPVTRWENRLVPSTASARPRASSSRRASGTPSGSASSVTIGTARIERRLGGLARRRRAGRWRVPRRPGARGRAGFGRALAGDAGPGRCGGLTSMAGAPAATVPRRRGPGPGPSPFRTGSGPPAVTMAPRMALRSGFAVRGLGFVVALGLALAMLRPAGRPRPRASPAGLRRATCRSRPRRSCSSTSRRARCSSRRTPRRTARRRAS